MGSGVLYCGPVLISWLIRREIPVADRSFALSICALILLINLNLVTGPAQGEEARADKTQGPFVCLLEQGAGAAGLRAYLRTAQRQPVVDPRQERFDVLHYDLQLNLDPGAAALSGRVAVTFTVVADTVTELVLDFLNTMTVDGASALAPVPAALDHFPLPEPGDGRPGGAPDPGPAGHRGHGLPRRPPNPTGCSVSSSCAPTRGTRWPPL